MLGGCAVHSICRDLADIEAEQKTLEEVGLFGSVVHFLCVCLWLVLKYRIMDFFSLFLFIVGT